MQPIKVTCVYLVVNNQYLKMMNYLIYLLYFCMIFVDTGLAQETRNLEDFDAISVATGVEVHLVKSTETKAVVTLESAESEELITKIRNNRLLIKFDDSGIKRVFKKGRKASILLHYRDAHSISVSSGGVVDADHTIERQALDLEGSSGGVINLKVNTTDLEVDISSGGVITLAGTTENLHVEVSSGASMRGQDLKSDHAEASASSAGVASFHVSKSLDAIASSGGGVRYTGNPDKLRSNSSSGGKVRSRE